MDKEIETIELSSEGYITRRTSEIQVWLHQLVSSLAWRKDFPYSKDVVLEWIEKRHSHIIVP